MLAIIRYHRLMPRGVYKRDIQMRKLGRRQRQLIDAITHADSEWIPYEVMQKLSPVPLTGLAALVRTLVERGLIEVHSTLDEDDLPGRRFFRYRAPGTPPGDFNQWLGRRIMERYPQNYDVPLHPDVVAMLERNLDLVETNPWLAAAYYAHEAATAREPSMRACSCRHEPY